MHELLLLSEYRTTWLGLWFILSLLMLQSLVSAWAHAKQPGAIPGKPDPDLSHASFEFRAYRTFHNSLENLPMMAGSAIIGILTGMSAHWLAVLTWTYALARLVHMLLYYAIATEKNPSPRSYFYLIALLANLILMGLLANHLLS